MKLASVLLIVPAAISLAVPAHADPSGGDTDFFAALKQAGISYSDPDKVVAAGKGICDQVDHGQSATDVVNNLTDANPGFTTNGAVKFAVIAATAYCPHQLSGEAVNGGGQAVNDTFLYGSGDGGAGGGGG